MARDLAVKQALREQAVDNRLNSHEMRLNAINGSQAEMVKVQKSMQNILDRLERKIDTAAEVSKAVAEQGVSTRTFVLTALGLFISLSGVLAGTGHL